MELVTEIAGDPMEPGDALEIVGLGDRADHFPAQLSGGEQQRVDVVVLYPDDRVEDGRRVEIRR